MLRADGKPDGRSRERVGRCPGCGSWRAERGTCDVCAALGACQLCGSSGDLDELELCRPCARQLDLDELGRVAQ